MDFTSWYVYTLPILSHFILLMSKKELKEKNYGSFYLSLSFYVMIFFFFFSFIFISWRLITLQYCSGFCHTLKCYDFHCMFLFSHLVMSDSFWPHGLQHSRLHCSLLYLKVCSNSCSFCQWCHWTVSSSVVPFSSCLQSFQALESFPMI